MTTQFTIHTLPWFDRLFWAGGHSLWQGALAAGIVWICGRFVTSARAKHALSWTALLCVLLMFAANYSLAPETVQISGSNSQEGLEAGAMGAAMWLGSAAALVSLLAYRFAALSRLVSRSMPVSAEQNRNLIEAQMMAGGPDLRPNTVICTKISTPAAAYDRVLLPPDCLEQLDQRELASVIAHENAHLTRGDFWLNVFQNLLEAALIFNPFAWYLSARIRVEREHCCDDDAVAATGDVVAYGRALAKLAVGRELQPALAIAMADARVSHRIRRLAAPHRVNRGGAWVPLIAVAGSSMAFGLFAVLLPEEAAFRPETMTIQVLEMHDVKGTPHFQESHVTITSSQSTISSWVYGETNSSSFSRSSSSATTQSGHYTETAAIP